MSIASLLTKAAKAVKFLIKNEGEIRAGVKAAKKIKGKKKPANLSGPGLPPVK